MAWRSSLASLSVAIECFEALPVRTLVDLSLVMGVYGVYVLVRGTWTVGRIFSQYFRKEESCSYIKAMPSAKLSRWLP